jgi:hypothetical protein
VSVPVVLARDNKELIVKLKKYFEDYKLNLM